MEVADIIHQHDDDESKETTITYFYALDDGFYHPITDIRHKELLLLNNLRKNEHYPLIVDAYFEKLKSILISIGSGRKQSALMKRVCSQKQSAVLTKAYKAQKLNSVFDHLKQNCSISYILPDLMLFFCAQLKALNKKSKKLKTPVIKKSKQLKAPVILKALKCIFLSNVSAEEDLFIFSLETFIRHSLKSHKLRYLLKNIAADLLSELNAVVHADGLRENEMSWLLKTIRNPEEPVEVLYSAAVEGLAIRLETKEAKIIPGDVFYDELLAKRSINCLILSNKLWCICEPFIYCCIPEDLSLPPNETNSLYNINGLVVVLYNFIRNAALHTPISSIKYELRIPQAFQFSHILFDENKLNSVLNSVIAPNKRKRRLDTNKNLVKHAKKQKLVTKSLYADELSSSCREDLHIMDVFANIEARAIDHLQEFNGYDFVEDRYIDYEKANVRCESEPVPFIWYYFAFLPCLNEEIVAWRRGVAGKKSIKRRLEPVE